MITKAYSILIANTLLVALVLILASFPSPAFTAAPSREKLTLQIHSDRMGNAGYFGGNFIADILKYFSALELFILNIIIYLSTNAIILNNLKSAIHNPHSSLR